jgi:putative cell wall-binding protein
LTRRKKEEKKHNNNSKKERKETKTKEATWSDIQQKQNKTTKQEEIRKQKTRKDEKRKEKSVCACNDSTQKYIHTQKHACMPHPIKHSTFYPPPPLFVTCRNISIISRKARNTSQSCC